MVFNGGRFAACEHWHGSPNDFDHTLASASGVGVLGRALAIHCLAADDAGEPVENPRQVPAYKYSRRYGPRPPCFARATRLTRRVRWRLVAARRRHRQHPRRTHGARRRRRRADDRDARQPRCPARRRRSAARRQRCRCPLHQLARLHRPTRRLRRGPRPHRRAVMATCPTSSSRRRNCVVTDLLSRSRASRTVAGAAAFARRPSPRGPTSASVRLPFATSTPSAVTVPSILNSPPIRPATRAVASSSTPAPHPAGKAEPVHGGDPQRPRRWRLTRPRRAGRETAGLRQQFDQHDCRHDRLIGKVALEIEVVRSSRATAHRLHAGLDGDDLLDQAHRWRVRQQREILHGLSSPRRA